MFSFASQKMASGEAAVQPIMTSNPAIASRLQSVRPVGRVAELGSLGVATRVVFNGAFPQDLSNFMTASSYSILAPCSGSRCPSRQNVRSVAVQS